MNNAVLFQAIQGRAIKELTPKLRVGPKSNFWIHALINSILNLVYSKDRKDTYLKNYNTIMEPRREHIQRRLRKIAIQIQSGHSPVKNKAIVKIAESEYDRLAA